MVGGVCGLLILAGLIWFLLRKRRSRTYARQDEVSMDSNPRAGSHSGYDTSRRETSELEGNNQARGELYDPSPLRNELPADDRLRMELNGDLPREVKVVKQDSASELP